MKEEIQNLQRENTSLMAQVTGLSEIISSLSSTSEDVVLEGDSASSSSFSPVSAIAHAKRRLASNEPTLPLRVM